MGKNKTGRHLKFYLDHINGVELADYGLCNIAAYHGLIDYELLKMFEPTQNERMQLDREGLSVMYWGSGVFKTPDSIDKYKGFTPLRQTIILLMAAINNEL